jgi:hypothetical protein
VAWHVPVEQFVVFRSEDTAYPTVHTADALMVPLVVLCSLLNRGSAWKGCEAGRLHTRRNGMEWNGSDHWGLYSVSEMKGM